MRAVVLCVLAGCAGKVDQADFSKQAAKVLCDRYASCAEGYLEAEFGTEKACRETLEDEVGEVMLTYTSLGCDWDAKLAGECLGETGSLSCAEFYEADMVPDEASYTRGFIIVPLDTCSTLIEPCLGPDDEEAT